MTAYIRHPRRVTALGLVTVAALAAALLAVTSAGAGTGGDERKLIGQATVTNLRAKVTALKVDQPKGEPPAATVKVAAFRRSGGEWNRLGRPVTVGGKGSWFWNVVTRRYGVRKLTVAQVANSEYPDRIGLRLLISPSIGPTGTFWFTVEDGKLVAVDV